MKIKKLLVASAAFLALAGSANAAPLVRDEVPEPLKPWIDWVLRDQEDALCPFLNGNAAETYCAWPSPLSLSLNETSGSFSQSWRVYADEWVSLPGDEKRWPLDVKADGQAAAVVFFEDEPRVFLKKGDHTLQGSFAWDSLPESFPIPPETGALKLVVKGKAVDSPNITEDSVLWLQSKTEEGEAEDSFNARVFRQMDDDIPFTLTTAIDLDVAGKTREAVFAPLLPEKFVAMSLESPLPAKLEEDGRLKVQVRSGQWHIQLKARHEGPVSEIALPKIEEPAAEDKNAPIVIENEIWVFVPHADLRLANVDGVPAIDPNQTTLPDEWKRLAAYQVNRGDTVRLTEQRRGDAEGAPDQLTLNRQLWLDFDGKGYTIQDRIGGSFQRNSRLEMAAPLTLGRAAADGQDQLITRVPGSEATGIEVRQGATNINADSRIDKGRCKIPAVGWNHDFQSVSGSLQLPPGWRAIAIWGADHVPNTWLNLWTLLDIFLVLVLALSVAKIWNVKWGGIAFASFVLAFPEHDAPKWVWLAVLVGEALVRLLPPGFKGKVRIPLKLYRAVALITLFLIALPYAATSLRQALYPALENPSVVYAGESFGYGGLAPASAPAPVAVGGAMNEPPAPPPPAAEAQALDEATITKPKMAIMRKEMPQQEELSFKSFSKRSNYNQNLMQQMPGAQVQTGPGLPRWNWSQIPLQWSGPVAKDQTLRLILFGPCLNLFLAFLRVLLIALLIVRVLGFPGKFWPVFVKKHLIAGLLLVIAVGTIAPKNAHADFPSPDLLNQLRDRLTQKAECSPNCADLSRVRVEATATALRMRLEIATQSRTAVPIPTNPKEWTPQQVSVDGGKFAGVGKFADDLIWVELEPGAHQVVIEGSIAQTQSLQIPLPLKPHRVESSLQGWTLEGVHEDGQAEGNLQLTRLQTVTNKGASGLQTATNTLPPFVRVERRIVLGLKWSVETRVVRLTPTGTSIVLEVPLLDGESVTSEGIRVQNGKVSVSLSPQVSEVSWSSVLQTADAMTLKASDASSWVESWTLEAGAIWHVDATGIPIVPAPAGESGVTQWRPWPGEQVALKISRPQGVPGQTVTIDHSLLSVSPGIRFTESTLTLDVRSSLGGQHTISLPEGSELQSVLVNNQQQPIRAVAGKVTLPLTPGVQSFQVKWQQPVGVGIFFRGPVVNLGVPSVNADVSFAYPERWILLVGGPRLGPAVLFWSLLIVMVLVAVGLSKTGLTPLSTLQWILLSLGLTQTPVAISLIFAGWFLILGWRQKKVLSGPWVFDLLQILLALWTVTAVSILFESIHQGLLGSPDMQIVGNNSTNTLLQWFQDRSAGTLPRPWVFSLPMFCYRIAMLAWALWVAWAFIGWLKWAWKAFTKGGAWKPVRVVRKAD